MTQKDVQLRLDRSKPTELIDTTNFIIDLAGRKSISIGFDPSNDFNVSIQIITQSRFVCITREFLCSIYSLMWNILPAISNPPIKGREKLFLETKQSHYLKLVIAVKIC